MAINIPVMMQVQYASISFAFWSTDFSFGKCRWGRGSFFMFISFSSVPIDMRGKLHAGDGALRLVVVLLLQI